MNRGRLIRYAAIAAGAAVVIAVGVAAFESLQTPFQPASTNPGSATCTPKPCANVRGYILWVSDLKVDAGMVTMQLTFRNSSPATHADPADLRLLDAKQDSTSAVHDAPGCSPWPRSDFSNGAAFGPVPECFRPATTTPPLTLHWTPDMGLFCCETDIALEPPAT
jgi:hypothetical protein